MWSKTDPERCEFESPVAAPWMFACRKCSARTRRRAARRAGGSGPLPVRWSPSSISRGRTACGSPVDRLHFLAQRLACRGREVERRASDGATMNDEPIDRNPDILGGTPVFAHTRVPVRILMEYLEAGDRLDDFLEDFPSVSRGQAVSVLEQARMILVGEQDEAAA